MRGVADESGFPSANLPARVADALEVELYDEVAYSYDGTLEGLLTAIFQAYARHEDPTDIAPERELRPRLAQRVAFIETDVALASRVRAGLCRKCGYEAYDAVRKAALAQSAEASTAAYRFVRYAMDEHASRDCGRCRRRAGCPGTAGSGPCPYLRGRAVANISHPAVAPVFKLARAIDGECEHMRQFIRFEHLEGGGADFWFARCNPRYSVIPLVMGHFAARFNMQSFVIYDENHGIAGVYGGGNWHLVRVDETPASQRDAPDAGALGFRIPPHAAEEDVMQDAWRRFYRAVAVESRYNPELRRHFMPKRFWRNLTEMQELGR